MIINMTIKQACLRQAGRNEVKPEQHPIVIYEQDVLYAA